MAPPSSNRRSKKKDNGSEEKQEEEREPPAAASAAAAFPEDEPAAASTQEKKISPSMSLRSGKKKRRRSAQDSRVAEPSTKKKKKQSQGEKDQEAAAEEEEERGEGSGSAAGEEEVGGDDSKIDGDVDAEMKDSEENGHYEEDDEGSDEDGGDVEAMETEEVEEGEDGEDRKMPAAAAAAAGEEQQAKPSNGSTSVPRQPNFAAAMAGGASADGAAVAAESPPAAAAAAAASVQEGHQKRPPEVGNLRMVSQQTPARVLERERLKEQAAVAAGVIPTGHLPPPNRRLIFQHQPKPRPAAASGTDADEPQQQRASAAAPEPPQAIASRRSCSDGGAPPILENGVRAGLDAQRYQQVVEAEVESGLRPRADAEAAKYNSSLSSSTAWFFIILVLAGVSNLLSGGAFRSTFVDVPADQLVAFRRYCMEKDSSPDGTIREVNMRIKDKVRRIRDFTSRLDGYEEQVSTEMKDYDDDKRNFLISMERRQEDLQETTPKVESLTKLLESALQSDEMESGFLKDAREILGDEDPLLDLSFLESWDLPEGPECTRPPELSLGDFTARSEALKEKAKDWAQKATENPELEDTVRTWLRDSILGEIPEYEGIIKEIGVDGGESEPGTKTVVEGENKDDSAAQRFDRVRVGLEDIQKMIRARFELERADQTGRVDYASIMNGATVIRSGEFATTASLAQELPVLNRMAALLSLRFYGYGAEAALTPTHPPNALGQCWAFTEHSGANAGLGAYATLSINLAKAIRVQRISIDHPPTEISGRNGAAIRRFRIFGFEGRQAQGRSYMLGTFEYAVRRGEIRQEFNVADVVKGEKVPPLASIALAIDSNWGMEYACLYRFRVFGRED